MEQVLVLTDDLPVWITQYLLEIETRDFGPGFANLDPTAELLFGTQLIKGREKIKRFFEGICRSLLVKHEIAEFWDGSPVKMLRGQLTLAKHQNPSNTISPPMVQFLTMSPSMKVQKIAMVVGPMRAFADAGVSEG